jgi:hypothetical protein
MKTIIMLAANASEAAYGRNALPEPEFLNKAGLKTVREEAYPPSFDGSIKQLALRAFVPTQPLHDVTEPQILIIAVKGSASFIDWITNFNGDPVESRFVVCIVIFQVSDSIQ